MATATRAAERQTPRQYELLGSAARRCGVSHKTLVRWSEAGRLRLYQPAGPGGRVLVASRELDALIESGVR